MITAFGGGAWCREMTLRWAGKNAAGLTSLKADGALDVYAHFFDQPHTIEASNKDYEAGAGVDIKMQEEDQAAGRKIPCPLLLVYSESYIGRRYKFPDVWHGWVEEGVMVEAVALGDEIGHFGAEEAPEESARVIGTWLETLVDGK